MFKISTSKIDYLRISITDRCNLRCIYCMPPQGVKAVLQNEILTFEETIRLVNIFAGLGVEKIRLTGGEPLVRRDIVKLISSLANINYIDEVSLTTNGILLPLYAQKLKEAGLKRINISLDTLNREKFKKITKNNLLDCVLKGIGQAKQVGFYPLKLNVVIMKDVNNDEIIDFVEFAISNGLILRFIELMNITPLWKEDYFIPIEEIKEICEKKFELEKILENLGPGPAEYYKLKQGGMLGFIKTDEDNCKRCSRLRLTSTGELKICLYEKDGLPLKKFLRDGTSDGQIADIIEARIKIKKELDYKIWESPCAYMCSIGG